MMEHSIRAQIKDRFEESPVFYGRLSEELNRIISEMRQRVIDAAEAIKKLASLRTVALRQAEVAAEHGLSEVAFALYYVALNPLLGNARSYGSLWYGR